MRTVKLLHLGIGCIVENRGADRDQSRTVVIGEPGSGQDRDGRIPTARHQRLEHLAEKLRTLTIHDCPERENSRRARGPTASSGCTGTIPNEMTWIRPDPIPDATMESAVTELIGVSTSAVAKPRRRSCHCAFPISDFASRWNRSYTVRTERRGGKIDPLLLA